jgi:RHS repeat-associated protein
VRYKDTGSVAGGFDVGDTDVTTYSWDHRNRLVEVTHYAACVVPSDLVVDYAYDFVNRLVRETVDPDGTTGSEAVEQTVFVYDGSEIVLQFEGTGGEGLGASDLSHRYLWGPAIDQILANEQVDETLGTPERVLWGLSDHQGTIRDVVDNTGTAVDHRVFNSFGEMTHESATATDFLFAYTGRMLDKTTGLQNNLNRWYDPATGRWVSQDPIGFLAGDANLYRYVGNSATNCVDPTGLSNAWNPLTWGLQNGSQSWWEFFDPFSQESLTAIGALPGAYVDTATNGQQISSLSGAVDSGTGAVNPFGPGTHIGPRWGQNGAYAKGQTVGKVWGFTVNTILTVAGTHAIITSVKTIATASGPIQVGVAALAGGGTKQVVVVNGVVMELTPALAAKLGLTAAKGVVSAAAGSNLSRAVGKDGTAPSGRPGKTIANQNGVRVQTHGTNDIHKPAHAHVQGGGSETRIGQNGKPLKGQPELTPKQRKVVKDNIEAIRKEVGKIGRANKRIEDCGKAKK